MKHLTDVYKAYQRYNGPEGAPREVPSRVKNVVEHLQKQVADLPPEQQQEFQKQIDDIITRAQEKDMNNKLAALGVAIGKAASGAAGGMLLGPAGGVVSSAAAQYFATEFENAAKKEEGVIRPAEKIAGRRVVRRSRSPTREKPKSPTVEAAKTAVKSTVSSSVGGVGGIAKGVWEGVKSLWAGRS